MRYPEVVHMADGDSGHSPVWARSKKRRRSGGGGAFFGLIVTLLVLFSVLTIALSFKEGSVAAAGAQIDGWISVGRTAVLQTIGKAPKAAEVAAGKAGDAASNTGEALKAGAAETADTLKKQ